MALKTDYKDYVYSGNQKFKITANPDGTSTITDSTTYSQVGDTFGASDLNATNEAVNNLAPTVYTNITVDVTPTALSTYCDWDTKQKYGYSATVTVSGLTTNSLIQNLVMTDTLLSAVASVVTTITDGLVFYTTDETVLTGVIYNLVTTEVEWGGVIDMLRLDSITIENTGGNTVYPGETTGSTTYAYSGDVLVATISPSETAVTYQWYCSSDGTTYTAIDGETNSSYTVNIDTAEYIIVKATTVLTPQITVTSEPIRKKSVTGSGSK